MIRSYFLQKFSQVSCLLDDDLLEQLVSAPIMTWSSLEQFTRRISVRLDIVSRKFSSWPEVGAYNDRIIMLPAESDTLIPAILSLVLWIG